jgi:hypothetical protein
MFSAGVALPSVKKGDKILVLGECWSTSTSLCFRFRFRIRSRRPVLVALLVEPTMVRIRDKEVFIAVASAGIYTISQAVQFSW